MTLIFARFAIAIGGSIEGSIVLKATLVLGLTLAAVRLAPRARASIRHIVLAAAFCVLLTLPIVAVLLPPVVVHIPVSTVSDSRIPLVMPEPSPAVGHLANADGQAPAMASPRPSVSASAAFRAGWTVGAVLFLIPMVVSLVRIRRIRRRSLVWSNGELLVRTLAAEAGIRRRVAILSHEEIVAPITCGFLRPAIVLPSDANNWSDADLRHAIVHELEHVRRADWPFHLVARFVCAVYWFHPFVWIAWRRLCLDSERACDDAVLLGAEQTAYADQLVRLARRMLKRTTRHALSMANRSDLAARISAVLDTTQPRGRVGAFGASAITAMTVALLLAISPLRASGRSSDARPSGVTNSSLLVGVVAGALRLPTQLQVASFPAVQRTSSSSPPSGQASSLQAGATTASAFEVASVKPNPAGFSAFARGPRISGDELTAVNMQLQTLIYFAYNVDQYHLSGAPSWVGGRPGTERFDISAKAHAPASADQMRLMLRQLLVDRFHLVTHTEIRDTPIYALVVMNANGPLGPNLHRAEADCATLRAAAGGELSRTTLPCGFNLQIGRRAARGLGIRELAGWLAPDAGRPVVDMTGLDGVFDFDLTYTPDQLRHHPPDRFPSVDPDGPSVFAAVQEQLGLKLEPQEGLGDVLVIDHVEHPTPD
jgi:bla regulator protein blaR1